jgi:hypothetical protein
MNDATLLYTALGLIVAISLAFLAQGYHRRGKASPLEMAFYMTVFVGLAFFSVVFKQGIDIALDPGLAHPVAYNGGEGCNPDCLPPTMDALKVQLNMK